MYLDWSSLVEVVIFQKAVREMKTTKKIRLQESGFGLDC